MALAFVGCKEGGNGQPEKGDESSARAELARLMVAQYATEAFPLWARAQVSKQCPDSIQELATYTGKEDSKDPWGNELVMLCGKDVPAEAKGFGVVSMGADGKRDTADDIRSWEARR